MYVYTCLYLPVYFLFFKNIYVCHVIITVGNIYFCSAILDEISKELKHGRVCMLATVGWGAQKTCVPKSAGFAIKVSRKVG